MNIKKSHFWYNERQRNGVFLLAGIIIVLQIILFFVDFPVRETMDLNTLEVHKFEKEIDSLNQIELEKKAPKNYSFNPSFITDFKGYQLGMSTEEIDRLFSYRAQGKYINSVQEFQQVTGVSDSLLNAISPMFRFPDWVVKKQLDEKSRSASSAPRYSGKKSTPVKDINSVSAEELKTIYGVGDTLAQRIINYGASLQGYSANDQLYEVYYLDKEVADRVLERFQVLKKPQIKKININQASFKEVLAIVYVDYDLTKKIFEYRDEVSEFQSLEELKQIEGFPIEKFDRIALYLQAK